VERIKTTDMITALDLRAEAAAALKHGETVWYERLPYAYDPAVTVETVVIGQPSIGRAGQAVDGAVVWGYAAPDEGGIMRITLGDDGMVLLDGSEVTCAVCAGRASATRLEDRIAAARACVGAHFPTGSHVRFMGGPTMIHGRVTGVGVAVFGRTSRRHSVCPWVRIVDTEGVLRQVRMEHVSRVDGVCPQAPID
jgi:hypothetical protein